MTVNPHLWWYLARASGLVAMTLLVLTLLWGVLLHTRALRPHDSPRWLQDLHRMLAGTALSLTALHVVAVIADSYTEIGWGAVFVPFASPWRPFAVALGSLALYLLGAIMVTSWLMRHFGKKWWRRVHVTSYTLAYVVLLHAGLAGSDVGNPVYRWFSLTLVALVTLTAAVRVVLPPRRPARRSGVSRRSAVVPPPVVQRTDSPEGTSVEREYPSLASR